MAYPRQIKFIIGNEICERFSYYGMMGILELYMAERLKMGGTEATEVLHLFGTAVYFLPLLGGWIADRWLGRYWTILGISLFYCLGHGTLSASEGSRAGLFAGLVLIAIGAGGIKPNVSAFVGDQFGVHQEHLLTKVYGWFYWAINLGAAAAFFIIPWVRRKAGYSWAFGIPGIAMGLATLIFWLGRRQYARQPPTREAPRSTEEKADDRVTLWRIGVIFLPVSMFWALFNQVNSTWVLQGGQMKPFYALNGETMQGAGAVLVMIWTPILTLVVYPLTERLGWRPTALRRMAAGMVLGAVSFVLCGALQAWMDGGHAVSILWQLAPYVVLEAGEVLVSATGLEFAFEQAPGRLKSVVMSLWLMTIAAGHFLIAVFTGLNDHFIGAHGAAQIYLYAGMLFVVAGIFMVFARQYAERPELEVRGMKRREFSARTRFPATLDFSLRPSRLIRCAMRKRMKPRINNLLAILPGVMMIAVALVCLNAWQAGAAEGGDEPWLAPYTGPSRADIDATTLDGKVLCGYQGWFNTPCDGERFGFGHWGQNLGEAGGHFVVDMWPDESEYAADDLCAVPGLTMPDGAPARLYSAYRKEPVLLHCKWMRQYGIDGVFVSRFIGETTSPARFHHVNAVLASLREGCHREGRVWAMMLDVSMGRDATTAMVMNDWKFLCDKVKVREDSRYLHHHGKPVVMLWGLGFKDRPWTPEQGEELIRFFENDPKYGGVYLIGGVDPYWRTLKGASRTDPAWPKVYRMFDAISPWDAGRFRDDASMDRVRTNSWEGDLAELKGLGIGYMPTAFPGFSWDNLRQKPPGTTTIPRNKGEFYWRQFAIFRKLGILSVFVGMFDEVNEGTAIYKVANTTPSGVNFVGLEGLPTDWYLRLTGAATRMIRGETPLSTTIPDPLPIPSE